jgi:2-oxo-3-hexenedioate decarboxylase
MQEEKLVLKSTMVSEVSTEILSAMRAEKQIPLISDRGMGIDITDAYKIAYEIEKKRIIAGEKLVGLKIGFTNRTIWKEYNAEAPILGAMYDTTVLPIEKSFSLDGLIEPRIEPEIIFKIGKEPKKGMTLKQLLDCISHVSHGFEIVQSIFKDWKFKTVDTIAAFGLHGALIYSPFVEVSKSSSEYWLKALSSFKISLSCNGELVDTGISSNVLDKGPLGALHYILNDKKLGREVHLRPRDLITTGTLTKAFPIRAGEVWSTELSGIDLLGIKIHLS